ncbi:MAG: hypothetical protein GY838_16290 [bacterium]|nr:hypothetical protein [bacterium]
MHFAQARPVRGHLCRAVAILALVALLAPMTANAAWDDYGWSVIFEPTDSVHGHSTASDGQGGTLVAYVDTIATFKVGAQRIDHAGTKLWGPDGMILPIDPAAAMQTGPVAICHDGAGGAFCIYRRIYSFQNILMASRIAADGSVSWTVPIDDLQYVLQAIRPRLVPTGDGEAIAVWTRGNGAPDAEIMATRIDGEGTVVWNNVIWSDNDTLIDYYEYEVCPDGSGGVLVGMDNYLAGAVYEKRVHRITDGGTSMWGAYGALAWTGHGKFAGVVADGTGGAYIAAESSYGQIVAQHFNAGGTATWITGGIRILDVLTGGLSANADICADGFGGLFVVAGIDDLHGQRVDVAGAPQWGVTGLQLTSLAGWQSNVSLAPDGFGGLLMVYRDHYWSEVSDPHARAISAKRFDHFGTMVWEHPALWWTVTAGMPDRVPWEPVAVADGSGGLQTVWLSGEGGAAALDIYAAGVGAAGSSPATPIVQAITPDGGVSGDAFPVTILGDYLDATQGFVLERTGSPILTISGLAGTGGRQVSGTLGLAGAHEGTYDLTVSVLGADKGTLVDAFGVGDPPPCAGDKPLGTPGAPLFAGSRRKVAFDGLGQARHVTLAYESMSSSYYINEGTEIADLNWGTRLYEGADYLRQVACAAGPGQVLHVTFVKEAGGVDRLMYIQIDEHSVTYTHELPVVDGVRNPVVAVDSTGLAHIVFESDIMGESFLFTTTATRSGLGGQTDLMSGTGATAPDLCRSTGGLTLTFVRDSWLPGWVEICQQRLDGTSWGSPTSFYAGAEIYSPSVAWDGSDLLFSFVLDNTGANPLLHTAHVAGGVMGPVRWRLSFLERTTGCMVSAGGPGRFFLLTEEGFAVTPGREILLRVGDGDAFGAPRLLNSHADVFGGYFAADPARENVFAYWIDYENVSFQFSSYKCFHRSTQVHDTPLVRSALDCRPNPFNPVTEIQFGLVQGGPVRLNVYDTRGRCVRTLVDEVRGPGLQRVTWDGRDGSGRTLAAGVYLSELRAEGQVQRQKMLLLK